MEHCIFTRAFSATSAGGLCSGLGSAGPRLTDEQLLFHFGRHQRLKNKHPTALVSVSDRIIDTLRRAFNKHYKDGESPEDIYIIFVKTLGNLNGIAIHSARDLAKKGQNSKSNQFMHEFLFEWAIPEKYVVHTISV
ncbi:hypothetical protein PT974_08878 [Cladobotryum mycophilum]|uniref:DUF7587 domain-containing protein n=1 Tax=Cladobotryum mycophilum TaxID=491253 RepID=A0ABR0SEQ3_9HYPO